ncbi:NIPSNAP family protein [Pedobacter sp. JCM 36344]|uniref:NIPSNAP family protein n=1 Tax=Pedobacter sp. JCM 36344 TaxID=3374280 RepID=UPI00397AB7D9
MKKITIALTFMVLIVSQAFSASKDLYQIKIYHLKNAEQELVVESYLEKAYLPALHRAGISKAGVFKNIKSPSADKKDELLIYVLVPYKSADDIVKTELKLDKDKIYNEVGAGYLNAAYNMVPYDRIETILINAFEMSPRFNLSAVTASKAERVYELRSYEGPTEKLYKSKVKMFNTGDEIGLFKRLGFNAVFYGSVIAGSRMPNLMYMTTFANKADRDKHWDAFVNDSQWKTLSAMEEYKNTVSKSTITFLYPTDYSDI